MPAVAAALPSAEPAWLRDRRAALPTICAPLGGLLRGAGVREKCNAALELVEQRLSQCSDVTAVDGDQIRAARWAPGVVSGTPHPARRALPPSSGMGVLLADQLLGRFVMCIIPQMNRNYLLATIGLQAPQARTNDSTLMYWYSTPPPVPWSLQNAGQC